MAASHYVLDEPIKYKGGMIAQLTVREPTSVELLRANKFIELSSNPEASMLFDRELVAGVSGVRPEALDMLDGDILEDVAGRIVACMAAVLDNFSPDSADLEIPLAEPLTVGGAEYAALLLRPARTGEMLKARGHLRNSQGEASQLAYRMSLVSQVTGIPLTAIHLMPASAVIKAAVTVEIFTRPGRRTGST